MFKLKYFVIPVICRSYFHEKQADANIHSMVNSVPQKLYFYFCTEII